MIRQLKTFVLVLIPLILTLVVAAYFGYSKYYEELNYGHDINDSQRWAFFYGLSFSPLGFLSGILISFLINMSLKELSARKNL